MTLSYLCFQPTEDGNVSRGGSNTPSNSGTNVRSVPRSRPPVEETHVGKYRLIKTIGKGNFAKVKLARHIPTDKEVRVSALFIEVYSFVCETIFLNLKLMAVGM